MPEPMVTLTRLAANSRTPSAGQDLRSPAIAQRVRPSPSFLEKSNQDPSPPRDHLLVTPIEERPIRA
jgi:hypothetical protein